mmetsp:Transcript_37501/g.149578  ORF Transcript_37501/g.149578 Transcript_37501/m.149578 type:complete len:164 (-) Transcript_37501:1757-2248(-)
MGDLLVFVDVFELRELDMVPSKDGKKVKSKKFDKVSRLLAQSESYDTEVILDFNCQILPLYEGEKFELALSRSLYRDRDHQGELESTGEVAYFTPKEGDSHLDDYDYVMHGKIFKYAEEDGKAIVYISYGGLLMALKGEPRTLRSNTFKVGDNLYLLLKKFST